MRETYCDYKSVEGQYMSEIINLRKRTFELSKLVSAYYFKSAPLKEPYVGKNTFTQLYVVISGQGYFCIEDEKYFLSPGVMICCPPGANFTYGWDDERVEYALISFVCESVAMKRLCGGPMILGEEEKKILIDTIRTTTHICDYSKVKKPPRIEIFIKEDTPEVVIDYIYSSLERFLTLVYCRLSNIEIIINENQKMSKMLSDSILVNDVKGYLEEHLCDAIRIDDICHHLGVSKTVLMEKFRKETNKTIIEYLNELKIGRAMDMIRNSAKSFTEISEELGFSSINYFSKMFKCKTGMTLTEFSCLVSKRGIFSK